MIAAFGLVLVGVMLVAAPPAPAVDAPAFEVVAIRGGQELVIRNDSAMVTIRLGGIEPLKSEGGTGAIDRLNQTNGLRRWVPVGSKVRLIVEDSAFHVFRLPDNTWVNRALVADGFARVSSRNTPSVLTELQRAEANARRDQRGMWSPDFMKHAARPATFERAAKPHPTRTQSRRSYTPTPPGGGMPALGMGESPMPASPFPTGMLGMSGFYQNNNVGYGFPFMPSYGNTTQTALGGYFNPGVGAGHPAAGPHAAATHGPRSP